MELGIRAQHEFESRAQNPNFQNPIPFEVLTWHKDLVEF